MTALSASPVLLCCETGLGRGHVTILADVARALAPEFRCQALIAQREHIEILLRAGAKVERCPVLERLPGVPRSPAANWAGWLRARGFGDPAVLRGRFDWWLAALDQIRPALLVGDFSPTALMAARARGIKAVAVGAAYGVPPATLDRYPDLLTHDELATQGIFPGTGPAIDEDALRETINATLGPLGLPHLAKLPEIYAADLSLPTGVAAWDPYDGLRAHPLILPLAEMPPLQNRPGAAVFVYFSGRELADPATLAALQALPYPATLVVPALSSEQAAALGANPRLRIALGPLMPAQIVAEARVIICAGQAGTLALAVLGGRPVLALPTHAEQLSNGLRAAAELGHVRVLPAAQRSADAILDTVAALWSRPALSAAARLMALDLRDAYPESALDSYRRHLLPLLRDGSVIAL